MPRRPRLRATAMLTWAPPTTRAPGGRLRSPPRAAAVAASGVMTLSVRRLPAPMGLGEEDRNGRSAAPDECPRSRSARATRRPREPGTRNKSQQRSEACDGGRADEIQTGDAQFKFRGQNRRAAVADDAAAQLRIQNVHLIDVNSVAGCQQDMIDVAGAAVQCQGDTIAVASRLENTGSFMQRNVLQAPPQPQDRGGLQAVLIEPVAGSCRQMADGRRCFDQPIERKRPDLDGGSTPCPAISASLCARRYAPPDRRSTTDVPDR